MDRIVFAGDSVTDMGSVNPVGEGLFDNLGHSYVRIIENLLAALYPEVHLRITNCGISGNTSRDLLARWERDVCALNPQWVSICIGINDVWRQFDSPAMPDQMVPPEEYRENIRKMILTEKPHVKGIILMTPYYMDRMQATSCAREWMNMARSARSSRQNTAAYSSICRRCSANTALFGIRLILRGTVCIRTRSARRLSHWNG